jgi:carboxymethylenebutenolidase
MNKNNLWIPDAIIDAQSLIDTKGPNCTEGEEKPASSMSRRTFLGGAAASGFAIASSPVLAQAISTDTAGLVAGRVSFVSEGVELSAYRAYPEKRKNAPVVLVVSEIFGVHEYIQDVCRRLAKAGYYAIATELFQRQGNPASYASIADVQAKVISKVPDAQVKLDLDNTVAFAKKEGANSEKLAITGFCWGGRITWLYAAYQPKVKAGVAWYGRLQGNVTVLTPRHPISQAANLNAPVLGLYGGKDTGIPLADIESMKAELLKAAPLNVAAKASEFVVYPEAPHAFHADYRASYRATEAKDGWEKALAWFKKHGVS